MGSSHGGVCEYCSAESGCCEAIGIDRAWGTGGSFSSHYFDPALEEYCRKDPPTWNTTNSSTYESTLDFCNHHCASCYYDPSKVISIQAFGSVSKASGIFLVLMLLLVVWAPLIKIFLWAMSVYVRERPELREKRFWRRFVVMPMLEPYLWGDIVASVVIFLWFVVTISVEDGGISTHYNCCGPGRAAFLAVFFFFVFMSETVPLLLLLQRSYTVRSLRRTIFVSCFFGSPYLVLLAMREFLDMSGYSRSRAAATMEAIYQILKSWMYVLNSWYVLMTATQARHLKLKPWAYRYVLGFWVLYIYLNVLVSLGDSGSTLPSLQSTSVNAILAPLCIYAFFFRGPGFFFCIVKETEFWCRDGTKLTKTSGFDESAIGEVQRLLEYNRHILIDYLSLKFAESARQDDKGDKRTQTRKRIDDKSGDGLRTLGTGATAAVYAAVFCPRQDSDERCRRDLGKKPLPVAVKVFTPDQISAHLLRVFAKEISLLRKLDHPNVVHVYGLSVMPPNVCVVLPFYAGGSLKAFLKNQRAIRTRTREKKIDDDDGISISLAAGRRGLRETRMLDDPFLRSNAQTPPTYFRRAVSFFFAIFYAAFCPLRVLCIALCCDKDYERDDIGEGGARIECCCCCCRRRRRKRRKMRERAWHEFDRLPCYDKLLHFDQRIAMCKQLTSALAYLHTQSPPILHRDIKPDNIMLDENLNVKLVDFGESSLFDSVSTVDEKKNATYISEMSSSQCVRSIVSLFGVSASRRSSPQKNLGNGSDDNAEEKEEGGGKEEENVSTTPSLDTVRLETGGAGQHTLATSTVESPTAFSTVESTSSPIPIKSSIASTLSSLPMTIRGSPLWMSPEILRGKHGQALYNRSADVYSTGIVIWQIASLDELYDGIPLFHVLRDVEQGSLRPPIPSEWPVGLKDLLRRVWDDDIFRRPQAAELDAALGSLMAAATKEGGS